MEFSQVGRDRYYGRDDDEDHDLQDASPGTSRCPAAGFPLPHPNSSPSTSSSSPTRWAQQAEATDDPPGAAADTPATDHVPLVPADQVEKEHMFDKVVTPSDVGKLNRLVIPKQHAERFFPLDSSTNERGLLLNFEDRTGKPWRFRYSYWNSSQSYVMTKGWSRFVKEKRLDAGDTVSFGRGVGQDARDRLFIDWKHRPESHDPPAIPRLPLPSHYNQMLSFGNRTSMMPWSRFFTPPAAVIPAMPVYDHRQSSYGYNNASMNPYLYFRSAAGGPSQVGVQYVGGSSSTAGAGSLSTTGGGPDRSTVVYDSVPVAHNIGNSRTVRLFGVNFDCSSSSSEAASQSQVRPLPTDLSLELSLGASTTDTTTVEAQSQSRDKQPMCFDF